MCRRRCRVRWSGCRWGWGWVEWPRSCIPPLAKVVKGPWLLANPAAVHALTDGQATLSSSAWVPSAGLEVGWLAHAVPFHRSARVKRPERRCRAQPGAGRRYHPALHRHITAISPDLPGSLAQGSPGPGAGGLARTSRRLGSSACRRRDCAERTLAKGRVFAKGARDGHADSDRAGGR